MGKKCFVPRCNTGYDSCQEKLSLFSVPKNPARLQAWRDAIPRKDRVLKPTDYVCEKHFEPAYVIKTWTAIHNGVVLASTFRRAQLSADAVPTIFPKGPCNRSEESKTAPVSRRPYVISMRAARNEPRETTVSKSGEEMGPEPPALDSDDSVDAVHGLVIACESEHGLSADEDHARIDFDRLFHHPCLAKLPSLYWSWSRVAVCEARVLAFHRMQATSTVPNEPTGLYVSKCLELDERLNARAVVMGRKIALEQLGLPSQLLTLEELRNALQRLDNVVVTGLEPEDAALFLRSDRQNDSHCAGFL